MDSSSVNGSIIKLVEVPLKIRQEYLNVHLIHTFQECLQCCHISSDGTPALDKLHGVSLILEIDSILDYLHEELNTGHWSKVPIETRQNFTIASFLKAIFLTRSDKEPSLDSLRQCLKALDLGLLLGAPLQENPDLLTTAAKILRIELNAIEGDTFNDEPLKRKLDSEDFVKSFNELDGNEVEELSLPSIETFNKRFFVPQIPVKLKDCMSHWPAATKWLDLNYLLQMAGNRTVPIELGSHYTDENWSQKLMTIKEFIQKHYLSEGSSENGYLAQHNLFDQIAELKEDIVIPDYCCCSLDYEGSAEPDINAWLGPKGTLSPLHQDPKNNILAQVYGTKQILLFSVDDTENVYPHDEAMLSNTARVDPLKPDFSEFPNFKKAKPFKCLLRQGEMLFIPVKWWHHVIALEKSFSVSFWWQ